MAEDLQHLVALVGERLRQTPASVPAPVERQPLPKTAAEIAPFIDHTLLKPNATAAEVEKLCAEARQFGFATVCVNGSQVARAARLLEGSGVRAIAVVGFPLGRRRPSRQPMRCATAPGRSIW